MVEANLEVVAMAEATLAFKAKVEAMVEAEAKEDLFMRYCMTLYLKRIKNMKSQS